MVVAHQNFNGSPLGVISLEFRRDLWHRQTRVPGLSCGVVLVILGLTIFVELRLVTDGRTDKQTDTQYDSIYRASIASRGKNGSHQRSVEEVFNSG